MDNSKSYLPHYVEHSKDQVQKERLPSKITGCTMYNGWYEKNRKVVFYINHDIFENGSNMIITTIYLLLHEFIKDHKALPRKLRLNLDNCWKENKNRYLFSFLASLVELNIFEEISIDCLLVGHTGNEAGFNANKKSSIGIVYFWSILDFRLGNRGFLSLEAK